MQAHRRSLAIELVEAGLLGAGPALAQVRDQFETHEFVEQYDDVDGSYFGIGVIVVPRSSSL